MKSHSLGIITNILPSNVIVILHHNHASILWELYKKTCLLYLCNVEEALRQGHFVSWASNDMTLNNDPDFK